MTSVACPLLSAENDEIVCAHRGEAGYRIAKETHHRLAQSHQIRARLRLILALARDLSRVTLALAIIRMAQKQKSRATHVRA